jgi:UDP-3-O-[3-hydroxymyristoyl] glucosamine N-acyltransferase
VTRINNFIDQVERDMGRLVPQGKGNLIIGGGTEPMELQAGPNNYCLTIDPTTPTGMVWEERVDVTTNQKVGGKKTFTSDLETLQDLQVGLDMGVGGNATVVGNLSARNGHLTGMLEVGSSTLLHSTLTVANNTTLRTNLTVGGATTLTTAVVSSTLSVGGDVGIDSGLVVGGPVTMQANVVVGGSANVSGSVVVGNDVLITDSLSVGGAANLSSLAVNGPTALIATTTNSLTVAGEANLNSLSLAGGLVVGTTLTTGGSITSGGDITTTKALTVGGASTFSGVTASTITTSGTTTTGKLVALQPATLNDVLWVGGNTELRSNLLVVSNSSLRGDLTVAGTTRLDRTATADISVNGAALIRESLTVEGTTHISDDITVDGSTFVEGSSTVELDLTVGGRTVLAGPLSVKDAEVGSLVTTVGKVGALTADTIRAGGIAYTGTLTGNSATLNTLSAQGIESTGMKATTLTITGSAEIPGLSGINTGDEVDATRTVSGTVRISSDTPDPIVYTVSDAQAAFLSKTDAGTVLATLVSGKVPLSQLPATAITDTHVVTTIQAMNALTAQVGDVAIVTNPASTYILQTEPNGWVMLNTPTDAIPSVYGRVGPIQAQTGDYIASMIPITSIPTLNAVDVQVALERLAAAATTHGKDTDNPHGVTAEQVGAIATWEKGSGMGVATLDVGGKVPLSQLPNDLLLTGTYRMMLEFSTSDLSSGVLIVQHGLMQKYPSSVTVYSNLDRVVVPDDIEVVDESTLKVYLSSFTTMQGTWKAVVSL